MIVAVSNKDRVDLIFNDLINPPSGTPDNDQSVLKRNDGLNTSGAGSSVKYSTFGLRIIDAG